MAALEVMQEEPWRQDKLRENFTYMRDELKKLGFELGKTETAVIPIYIRDDLTHRDDVEVAPRRLLAST